MMFKVSWLFLAGVVVLSVLCSYGQSPTAAKQALADWKAKKENRLGPDQLKNDSAAAVSVERHGEGSVRVGISVSIVPRPELPGSFIVEVQPIAFDPAAHGTDAKPIGKPAIIKTEVPVYRHGSAGDLTFDPQFILPTTPEVDAVRVRIRGVASQPESVFTLIVPIKDTVQTAVIGDSIHR